eukprot:scaffold66831_cov69-Phaeocystis_antarctica.AAC.3
MSHGHGRARRHDLAARPPHRSPLRPQPTGRWCGTLLWGRPLVRTLSSSRSAVLALECAEGEGGGGGHCDEHDHHHRQQAAPPRVGPPVLTAYPLVLLLLLPTPPRTAQRDGDGEQAQQQRGDH